MNDPLEKIAKRLDHVETLLMNVMKHLDDTDHEAAPSENDTKGLKQRAMTLEATISKSSFL